MATNILHYVPWFAPTREAVLSSKSTTSGIKFSYTSNTRACLVKKYSPATASFQDALQICPNMKVRNITACAKISEAPSESGPESAENAQQDNADNAQEVSADDGQASSDSNEAALESSPRAPRPKLSEVMGILHRRAIEAVDKKRPIPDVRVGDVLQLKVVILLKSDKHCINADGSSYSSKVCFLQRGSDLKTKFWHTDNNST
eukprot:TRINITY_DN1113_c0_g2_i2.p1 TRINITY_DN1113_c0_g2~~TRINITY_DN1113_c0_g2_i2.p1  ORF type:complete len:204 (-),score=45.53 TRINITY_DN1113_c0_g2_i2:743-1354(-)